MTHLLDTDTCIELLSASGSPRVARRLAAANPADVGLCSVVKAELLYGAHRSHDPAKNLARVGSLFAHFDSLPFDDGAANAYGTIRTSLEAAGLPIGPNDLMLATIAVHNDVTLVTHNVKEFARVPGLRVEDWDATP